LRDQDDFHNIRLREIFIGLASIMGLESLHGAQRAGTDISHNKPVSHITSPSEPTLSQTPMNFIFVTCE
jgi:hypothetical protein